MMPSPAGCLAITVTSPDPVTMYAMLVSRPLAEKRQMSAAATPVGGRCKGTGFPASEQELVTVEKVPRAATLRSTSAFGRETPAVVGSTTMMSLAVAEGATLVREITSSEALRATTRRETLLEVEASGLRTCTERVPGTETSAALTGAVHSVTELHVVVRAVPAISNAEPGPGVERAKLPPSPRRVKPLAAPA